MPVITYDSEQEQIVLGMMLNRPKARRIILRRLSSEDFIGKKHKIIYRGIQKAKSRRLNFDLDAVRSVIREKEEDWGGYEYLQRIKKRFGTTKNPLLHIDRLRRVTTAARLEHVEIPRLLTEIRTDGFTVTDMRDRLRTIEGMVATTASKIQLHKSKEILDGYQEEFGMRFDDSGFVSTGLVELDETLTEGLAKGRLTVCAGRPRMGKSSLMASVILKNLHRKMLVLPIEVGAYGCIDVMVSIMTGIPLPKFTKHNQTLSKKERDAIDEALDKITGPKSQITFLDHYHNKTGKPVDTKLIAEILEHHDFEICFLDLFDRLRDVSQDPSVMFAKLQFLQAVFQEKQCHGFVTAQINRRVEREKDKRPTLSDIKSCGGFEEVADLVLGIHREIVFQPDMEEDLLEILVLKQKKGPEGEFSFRYNAPNFRVGEFVANSNRQTMNIMDLLNPPIDAAGKKGNFS